MMREANQPNQPVRLQGIAAAPGLASGETFTWRKLAVDIPSYTIQDPEAEIERLAAARAAAGVEIDALRLKVEREVGSEEAAVFEAHSMFLDDSSLLEATESRIRNHLNAEAAWMQAIEKAAGELAQIPDPTLSARAVDVRDVGRRVLNHLLGHIGPAAPVLTRPMVLIAADLEPSETAAMDKSKVLAFCTAGGGPTSHTAILAKAMGLPAVVGLGERLL
ncbi:MAG: PEP-utilizing enzyme, partial [Chloroflexi bacterium]|nr:PEP-utilizing enzyme [Chloroflexota bacterium]